MPLDFLKSVNYYCSRVLIISFLLLLLLVVGFGVLGVLHALGAWCRIINPQGRSPIQARRLCMWASQEEAKQSQAKERKGREGDVV